MTASESASASHPPRFVACKTRMDIARQCLRHARNPAIVSNSEVLLHRDVVTQALHVRHALLDMISLDSNPVVALASPSSPLPSFVSALLGSWMAGAVAVPVPTAHPDAAIDHILRDSRPAVVLCDDGHVDRLRALHPRVVPLRQGARALSATQLVDGALDALGRSQRRYVDAFLCSAFFLCFFPLLFSSAFFLFFPHIDCCIPNLHELQVEGRPTRAHLVHVWHHRQVRRRDSFAL